MTGREEGRFTLENVFKLLRKTIKIIFFLMKAVIVLTVEKIRKIQIKQETINFLISLSSNNSVNILVFIFSIHLCKDYQNGTFCE